jgi:hypothetical protein
MQPSSKERSERKKKQEGKIGRKRNTQHLDKCGGDLSEGKKKIIEEKEECNSEGRN